jgi:hypothetical protein
VTIPVFRKERHHQMDHSTGPDRPDLVEAGRRARARLEQLDRRLRIARWADREMPLSEYYRTWGWPAGRYCPITEGWRAA